MDKGGKFAFICLVTKAANSRTMVSDEFLCFAHTHTNTFIHFLLEVQHTFNYASKKHFSFYRGTRYSMID